MLVLNFIKIPRIHTSIFAVDMENNMITNKPYNLIINVQGVDIQVTIFKLDEGVINIGRMHSVK